MIMADRFTWVLLVTIFIASFYFTGTNSQNYEYLLLPPFSIQLKLLIDPLFLKTVNLLFCVLLFYLYWLYLLNWVVYCIFFIIMFNGFYYIIYCNIVFDPSSYMRSGNMATNKWFKWLLSESISICFCYLNARTVLK